MNAMPAKLVFSHFGVFCQDAGLLANFYTNVLGFAVSDRGEPRPGMVLCFMTRRPFEHHQLVLAGGRAVGIPSTVNQIGFLAADLGELRRLKARLETEDGVSDIAAADHGSAWTLYFRDPNGNRVSVSAETGWFVPPPALWPLDLDASDAEIAAATEARCRAEDGFMARGDWRARMERQLTEAGGLVSQATPVVNPIYPEDGEASVFRSWVGRAPPVDPFPAIAMHQVGIDVSDLNAMLDFYAVGLGYLVTGRGSMDAIGATPASDYAYLTRDPEQTAQIILRSGQSRDVPSSVNQLTFRVTSLAELRRFKDFALADERVTNFRPIHHGNSFSLYCDDPEGNTLEISYESEWYIPAPLAWPLDFGMSDDELMASVEKTCRETEGFMMRGEWKFRARGELIRSGRLEAEALVSHLYAKA
jgi:catechol 2,3-dioxygenase